MKSSICEQLIRLNEQFYQTFGQAFSNTRQRIQPGVRRILEPIPKIGNWLDLGCGNGNLAVEWARQKREGLYIGVDFSPILLREAKEAIQKKTIPDGLDIQFTQVDLSNENWFLPWRQTILTGAMAFAVLHHIPDRDFRLRLLCQVNRLLPRGSEFLHSEWQFQNNARIISKKQPWSKIGIGEGDVDPGDTLLDWRHALPGQTELVGLRYVHLFSREELVELAKLSGFEILEEFESDGAGGKLGLYQRWRKT
jgi:tRNA (uracil-5-)-methyltransferase TRM9